MIGKIEKGGKVLGGLIVRALPKVKTDLIGYAQKPVRLRARPDRSLAYPARSPTHRQARRW